jgi:hypothetical protein
VVLHTTMLLLLLPLLPLLSHMWPCCCELLLRHPALQLLWCAAMLLPLLPLLCVLSVATVAATTAATMSVVS